jgi:hypothetical protein
VEALYDENQALLSDLFEDIELSSVEEVWDVNFINSSKHHFVLVLSGGVHFCTCMLVSTLGVICRHYWKVFLESTVAAFLFKNLYSENNAEVIMTRAKLL